MNRQIFKYIQNKHFDYEMNCQVSKFIEKLLIIDEKILIKFISIDKDY